MDKGKILKGLVAVVVFVVMTVVVTKVRLATGNLVPPTGERAAYVGLWKSSDGRRLRLYGDGSVEYHNGILGRRIEDASARFEGDKLRIDEGMNYTDLVITAPPHASGDKTVMSLDGVEFVKQGQ